MNIQYAENSKKPNLVIAENRNLAIFRGYRFQVSDTLDGRWDRGSSVETLQNDLAALANIDGYYPTDEQNTLFKEVVVLSHIIQAARRYSDFWESVNKDASKLNEFVKLTSEELDHDLDSEGFDYNRLMDLIEVDEFLSSVGKVVTVPVSNNFHSPDVTAMKVYIDNNKFGIRFVGESEPWYCIDVNKLFGLDLRNPNAKKTLFNLRHILLHKASVYEDSAGLEVRKRTPLKLVPNNKDVPTLDFIDTVRLLVNN